MALGRRLQLAAVVLFFVGYAVLSHYSNSNAQAQDLGAVLAFAPLLVIGIALVWRSSGILIAALAAAAAGLMLREFWPLFAQNFSLAVLIQQCGFYAILALSFARTLAKGRVPLCTQFADKIHGPLSPLELRYTRGVTVAWVVFFLLNVAASIVLFAFAPSRIWSLFVNFLSVPLVLLMFAAEYAVRRRVLPQVRRSGLMATLRVYFAKSP
jgi:uncharacterized membrane protein